MGTRGLYFYKWKGKYYVYYNHWDSYPEILGKGLVNMIPCDAGAYKEWLEKTRADYDKIEALIDKGRLTVHKEALLTTTSKIPLLEHVGVEGLESLPGYNRPTQDLYIEWTYEFDLDNESFIVNDCANFPLNNIPQHWDQLLELDEHKILIANPYHPPAVNSDLRNGYDSLHTSFVVPRNSYRNMLHASARLLFYRNAFHLFVSEHLDFLCDVFSQLSPEDFLFREIAFTTLCMASGSPDLFRMQNLQECKGDEKNGYVGLTRDHEGGQQAVELLSQIFSGHHLKETHLGSAPLETSYWLLDVLVCLTKSLHSQCQFEEAVSFAVSHGRSQGRDTFNAIISSIEHVVIIKVSRTGVQHTGLLHFLGIGSNLDRFTQRADEDDVSDGDNEDREEEDEKLEDEDNSQQEEGDSILAKSQIQEKDLITTAERIPLESSENQDAGGSITAPEPDLEHSKEEPTFIIKGEGINGFTAVMQCFDAAQLVRLKPNPPKVQGQLPNEIYCQIVKYVDYQTWKTCRHVSRPFRIFCSEASDWRINEDLEAVLDDEGKLLLRHTTECNLKEGPKMGKLSQPRNNWNAKISGTVFRWSAVVGNFGDGTTSYVPGVRISMRTIHSTEYGETRVKNPIDRDEEAAKSISTRLAEDRYSLREESLRARREGSFSAVPAMRFRYDLLERYMPTSGTPASTQELAQVFALAYFGPLGILGRCDNVPGSDYGKQAAHYAWERPLNTWNLVATRDTGKDMSYEPIPYAVVWVKQASEDSPEGWEDARAMSTALATKKILLWHFLSWEKGKPNMTTADFAVIIIVGSRLTSLRLANAIRTEPEFPKKASASHGWSYALSEARDAGIYSGVPQELTRQLQEQVRWKEYLPVKDAFNETDRLAIEKEMLRVKQLADELGDVESTM